MIRQFILLIAISLFTVQIAAAKKRYYSIQQITGIADLIVTGKIINISGNAYSFAIEQTIKGQHNKRIIVNMFREWTCDIRWKKAEVGQHLLLFLTKNLKDSFDIINGSTGEIFIINDTLHGIWGLKEEPILNEVITGLRNFLSCYLVLNKELFPKERIVFKQLKTDSEILNLGKLNKFSSWLFDSMKDYKLQNKNLLTELQPASGLSLCWLTNKSSSFVRYQQRFWQA